MDNERKERLAKMSGDSGNSKPPKYVVPLIRFNGNNGEFRKVFKDSNGNNVEEALVKPIEFIILKKRRLLSSFSPTVSYFTNEHNNVNDKLMLFKVIDKTVTNETTGYTDELRAKYQTLKTHEVIYVLYDGEVCKMEIKGGSLSGYYDYQKALTSEEKHSFEVVTVISSEKAKNESGFGYYKIKFDFKNDAIDFDMVEDKMSEVDKACMEADAYTKSKLSDKTSQSVNGNTSLSEDEVSAVKQARDKAIAAEKLFNQVATGKDDVDEINPEDIPF